MYLNAATRQKVQAHRTQTKQKVVCFVRFGAKGGGASAWCHGKNVCRLSVCVCVCLFVCLFVCLLINYNDAFDRTNVMASISVRQRINVHTMGTSRPSLSCQCPPIKKGPDPIPYPHRHPPKTTDKSLRNQENSNFAPQK